MRAGSGTASGGPGGGDRPRLLVSTGPLLLSPLGWTLDAIADAGFDGAELLLAYDPESRDPERVLRYAQEAGIDVPVVHGPYMLVLRNVLGSGYIAKTRRSLELAGAVGAEVLVAHAPYRWERRARGWVAGEVDEEALEHGPRFAMENLYPVAGHSFSSVITPEQLSPFRHVVFDTSHFAVAGVDLFAAWEALRSRVAHIHLSDNFGNGKDSHGPIGSGVLPLEAFLGHVGTSGYTGTVTLELDCRAYLDSRESLVAFLAGEREKAQALLEGRPLPEAPLAEETRGAFPAPVPGGG